MSSRRGTCSVPPPTIKTECSKKKLYWRYEKCRHKELDKDTENACMERVKKEDGMTKEEKEGAWDAEADRDLTYRHYFGNLMKGKGPNENYIKSLPKLMRQLNKSIQQLNKTAEDIKNNIKTSWADLNVTAKKIEKTAIEKNTDDAAAAAHAAVPLRRHRTHRRRTRSSPRGRRTRRRRTRSSPRGRRTHRHVHRSQPKDAVQVWMDQKEETEQLYQQHQDAEDGSSTASEGEAL